MIQVFYNLTKIKSSNLTLDMQQHLNTYKKFSVYLGLTKFKRLIFAVKMILILIYE